MNSHHVSLSLLLTLGIGLLSFANASTVDPGVGRRYPSERSVDHDKQTGWPVVRLTDSLAEDVKLYQTHPSWIADTPWIMFHSDRTGSPQLFAVHEAEGTIIQLTDDEAVNVGQVCLSRHRPEMVTLIGREIVHWDLESVLTSERNDIRAPRPVRRTVGRIPDGSELSGSMSLDASETALYLGLARPEAPPSKRWSVARFRLEEGILQTVIEPGFRVGHTQANPWNDDLVMFCHETGGDAPQRIWLLRVSEAEAAPFYRETFDEWVTHEIWWDATRALFTVWPKDENMLRRPHGIASVSLADAVRFHSRFPYWHVTGAAGSIYAVGDTFDGRIVRVNVRTGERLVMTQGHRPERSGAHPHPTLHPSGQRVLFNSNSAGHADLCVVDLEGDSLLREHAFRARRYTRRSAVAARAWQERLRADLAGLLKLDDLPGRNIPLNPRILGTTTEENYTVQEVEIASTPSRRITVRVTRPHEPERIGPAVVCLHGHGGNRAAVYDSTTVYKGFARTLAQRGYVTIAAEIGQHTVFEPDRTLMGERLWDLMRCVDYLQGLEAVDPERIGCAGLSLGGEMAMWLGALDPRVRATVSSGFLTTMDQMEQNHCLCWKFPGLRDRVDYADLYSLIAPRALQCQNGRLEGANDFWVPLARGAMEEIRTIYEDLGHESRVQLVVHEGGHEMDVPGLLAFLDQHLDPVRFP